MKKEINSKQQSKLMILKEYYQNMNMDLYEMTPSNLNHNYARESSNSDNHTYNDSAAFYFSEVFNPDMYDVEKVIDSND